ncbi:MAG: type II CAAX endopeptidase family protein [Dehalococcoidales bacterium]|jgi:membrane protease YdiL (CAAX protease family)|nr:type II CAAX endopeptidase family protein [Dehalococcoidales bacterium]MDX9986979.1 type II CAAX endopeptidase family protein [Dehalococcoidales bacterium]NLE90838.1 CPBP family intramembrane metalloprotease [Dehalococcoidales bacterium]
MHLALILLVFITIAECLTVFVDVLVGLALFGVILLATLIIPALKDNYQQSRLVLSLSLVPLVRIISLSMPLAGLSQIWWFPLMYLPLFLAAVALMYMLGLRFRDIGFTFKPALANTLIAISGIGLGFIEYFILQAEPLIGELNWQSGLLAAIILFVTTGFVEEIIFRGVMQTTALEYFGRKGIIYTSVLFAVLHLGFLSAADIIFVFFAGLYFAWAAMKTGSLTGVILAHGANNTVLFVIAPYLF